MLAPIAAWMLLADDCASSSRVAFDARNSLIYTWIVETSFFFKNEKNNYYDLKIYHGQIVRSIQVGRCASEHLEYSNRIAEASKKKS